MHLLTILFLCWTFLLPGQLFARSTHEGIKVYQRNIHTDPVHKMHLDADITRYKNADNLWDVLRDEFSLAHYENNPLVQDKIEWYMNNQNFLLRSASRAAPYLFYIFQQVKKRNLPVELVLLPIIESGYNPFALSSVGAAGIWQMMPNTATGLGLRQDGWYDGRRDIIASTRAALDYLAYLQSFFDGNWLLAIAAYNTGEGNVSVAIRKNIRKGKNTDYWHLPLAQQTRDYVPSLLALAIIISHPDQYPIYLPPVRNAAYLAQIDTNKQVSLKKAARFAGLRYKKLISLNPGFNRPSSAARRRYKLVLPIENVEKFAKNLARNFRTKKPINWIHYRVRAGDSLASIARRHHTTIAALRKMNHLPRTRSLLKRGATILIPKKTLVARNSSQGKLKSISLKKTKHKTLAHKARLATRKAFSSNNSKVYLLKPGDTVYIVRKNDTVSTLASRFNVSQNAIRRANKLTKNIIKIGDQLYIPTSKQSKKAAKAIDIDSDIKPGDTIYMVRRGDTIEKIARKFKTTSSAIKLANFVDNRSLFEGEKIIVPIRKSS